MENISYFMLGALCASIYYNCRNKKQVIIFHDIKGNQHYYGKIYTVSSEYQFPHERTYK